MTVQNTFTFRLVPQLLKHKSDIVFHT